MSDKPRPSVSVDGANPAQPLHALPRALRLNWYDAPREDPAHPDVHTYTDAMSYAPGDPVDFHSSTHAARWSLRVERDGARPQVVHEADNLPGQFHPTPTDAYRSGCGWPVAYRWRLPADLPSGFYRVTSTCDQGDGSTFIQHHWFVVRPTPGQHPGRLLLLLPTATWTAYNDWGGANHYEGIDGPDGNRFSPQLSTLRPWSRGMVWLPEGAPRIATTPKPGPGEVPRYQVKEWAYSNGYGHYYAAAGWAQYDRHFVIWAERAGFTVDMITQTDLHHRPELLDGYRCLAISGHDEYWSGRMRDHLDDWLDRGGRLARFAGNYIWQVRLDATGSTQTCWKYLARDQDPVRNTDQAHLLTSAWEDPLVNRPGATTVGVNGFRGVYVGFGGFMPRASRGFTVYRPGHWAFAGTDLYYGDQFGDEAGIFCFEVDGLEYGFRHGLPYPTGEDGAPQGVQILAMNVATVEEEAHDNPGSEYYVLDGDLAFKAEILSGEVTEESLARHRYGAGMVVNMPHGQGEVFTAGTCEWVMGLKHCDPYTEQITRNVLERFHG